MSLLSLSSLSSLSSLLLLSNIETSTGLGTIVHTFLQYLHSDIIDNYKLMSYKDLEVWQLAKENTISIHRMTLNLPSFEKHEEGRQIRRSSKSVRSNIVEGYGRKRYSGDFAKFVTYALASNDETLDHLEILFETGSLANEKLFNHIHSNVIKLGIKLNNFQRHLFRLRKSNPTR